MKVIEYLKEENYKDLSSEQRRLVAIQLIKDVSDYAMVHNISSDEAYEICSRDSIWSDLEFRQCGTDMGVTVNGGNTAMEKAIIELVISGDLTPEKGASKLGISTEEMEVKLARGTLQTV